MGRDESFKLSEKLSMYSDQTNWPRRDASDRVMYEHAGLGYSIPKRCERIDRHSRRDRITEGAEEIQIRRVAGYFFCLMKQRAPNGSQENRGEGRPICSVPTSSSA